jgi:hypothetical protein
VGDLTQLNTVIAWDVSKKNSGLLKFTGIGTSKMVIDWI